MAPSSEEQTSDAVRVMVSPLPEHVIAVSSKSDIVKLQLHCTWMIPTRLR